MAVSKGLEGQGWVAHGAGKPGVKRQKRPQRKKHVGEGNERRTTCVVVIKDSAEGRTRRRRNIDYEWTGTRQGRDGQFGDIVRCKRLKL
ncbi:hypothetical protein L596_029842 [Steinernema carpocapsae]|uniref:Uncharacterized protein n=1 Tax=Steinernema carpocapsae TaxID=34508 RepID=A0A4U5LQZ2_STECR|nr:hypothetical protein L596_029842 [Steinernema carpocapsae]